jgi:hypothetical protein
MNMMNRQGDVCAEWDVDNEVEVAAAKKLFKNLVTKERFLAFKIGETGTRGEQITEFDAEAERIVICPPMAGGA